MIKIERISNQLVKIGDATYNTGDVAMVQTNSGNRIKLVLKNGSFSPAICDDKFNVYANSAGVKYTTFAEASAAIAVAIAAGDGVSSIISDKGTVTQLTSKTTAVASNTATTTITTVALTDAIDTGFTFNLVNTKALTTSAVLTSVNMRGGTGKAIVDWRITAGGTVILNVTNVGTAAFNGAISIVVTIL